MTEFKTARERDAWGTIRGYVYQVDLTIERWLNLRPGMALQLERGEDIDTIQGAMMAADEERERLLEQVKVRNNSLTLRSESAIEAMASFQEHLTTNPGIDLSFRYVTNSQVGTEQHSPEPHRIPLITLWNRLREGHVDVADRAKTVSIIRGFLAGLKKPSGLADDTWNSFVRFVNIATDAELLSFIGKFEWQTRHTPSDEVGEQIRQALVSNFGIPPANAQTVYSILFLRVFKLLSQSGLKILTPEDRDGLIAAPILNQSDQILLENLRVHLTDLNARVSALEEAVDGLRQKAPPTAHEIRAACRTITTRAVRAIIEDQITVARDAFDETVSDFLTQPLRYCFVLGPSGVGKSISMAMEADRLVREGGAALLIPAKYFSLDEATRLIAQELPPTKAAPTWQQIVELLTKTVGSSDTAFVLFVDAIDEADDLDRLTRELNLLHSSVGGNPPGAFKVILSCRDTVWSRFKQRRLTPLYEDTQTLTARGARRSGYAAASVRLSDFTNEELDRALSAIGATELLTPGRYGETPNPHVATVRDLLKHPATFEHYSALRREGDRLSIQDVTWSYLIEERLRKSLYRAARQCGRDYAELRRMLERIVVLGWEHNSRDFRLNAESIRQAIPKMDEQSTGVTHSPLAALVENGILVESTEADRHTVGFRITDMAAYLLSFELERRSDGRNAEEFRSQVTQWLSDTWNFSPLLDALLAWIDRLVERPFSTRSLLLIDVLVETYHFRNSSIFGLMQPEVLKTIFDLIKRENLKHFYSYRDAALKIRRSPSALEEIRRHLRDENALARQLAAELAGAHQDEVAINELIRLLQDADKGVRDKAYKAFGYIGKSAVPSLLGIIKDASQPATLRGSCVTALRNIGYRDAEVSDGLRQSLEEAEGGNTELLKRVLLAAAHLRDKGHGKYAVAALKDDEERVVEAAAKYLTEAPDPNAFTPLRDTLRPWIERAGAHPHHRFTLSQITAAILSIDKARAEPLVLEMIREGLEGISELTTHGAIQMAEKLDLAGVRPLILQRLVEQLIAMPERNNVWASARFLAKTWRTEQLDEMVAKGEELVQRGLDVAKIFVDNIVPRIQISEKYPTGDGLNRVSDLLTVAKCQIGNFAPEASRLLAYSGAISCSELCQLLWVAGDTRAEESLLQKFENPSSENEARHERSDVVRALGTCGTRRGADAVLGYMRSDGDNISLDFHTETLYPLLLRGVITTDELKVIVRDTTMPWASRSMALLTLGIEDAPVHKDFFAEIAECANGNDRLQEYAVWMLGITKDKSITPLLRRLLSTSEHLSVKAQAAECLAWLDDRSAIHQIERALEDAYTSEYVSAFAHFHEETSLPILLDRLQAATFESRPAYLEALGAFWSYPRGREAILEQFDKWSSFEDQLFNNQSPLIRGLSEYYPDVILDQFNKSFDDGHLTPAARETMSLMMPRLFHRGIASGALLLETAKRLVCDKHVPARERTNHALGRTGPTFCLKLFEELTTPDAADEWQKSCAVYSLGFWESDLGLIEGARYDGELLVRRAADAALEMRAKRAHVLTHLKRYESESGLSRLSSYLCLCEKGDTSTIWFLYDDDRRGVSLAFREELSERIERRLNNEHQKKKESEDKLKDTRGTVTFD